MSAIYIHSFVHSFILPGPGVYKSNNNSEQTVGQDSKATACINHKPKSSRNLPECKISLTIQNLNRTGTWKPKSYLRLKLMSCEVVTVTVDMICLVGTVATYECMMQF